MRMYEITFRSVTYAQRGEALLRDRGWHCRLVRTPKWMQEQGCGYTLRLRNGDAAKAVALLRRNQIPFGKVYCRQDAGTTEEVAL